MLIAICWIELGRTVPIHFDSQYWVKSVMSLGMVDFRNSTGSKGKDLIRWNAAIF